MSGLVWPRGAARYRREIEKLRRVNDINGVRLWIQIAEDLSRQLEKQKAHRRL
jgi:hypothetical protein